VYKQLSGTCLGCFPKHFVLCLQPIFDLMAFGSSPFLEQFVCSNANLFQKLGSRSRLSNRPTRRALSAHIIAPFQVGGVCILGDGLSRPVMHAKPANAASLGQSERKGQAALSKSVPWTLSPGTARSNRRLERRVFHVLGGLDTERLGLESEKVEPG
jgi:hypothetical protein